MILQGNTYYLKIQIYDDTDNLILVESVDKVEFCFGKDVVKIYPSADVTVTDDSVFIVSLSQEDTFKLKKDVNYQFRVKFKDGQVKGTVPRWINVTESISKEIL